MRNRWGKWYQDYQDGRDFRGRMFFGAAARLAAVGYRLGYDFQRRFMAPRERDIYRPKARTIAVGNLTVGGSGKTSLVDYIATRLLLSGRRVVILTRGYGRRSKERIIIGPGRADEYESDLVGDEPLILARHVPDATVIVDADRATAAQDLERQSGTDVFLLDDALQYRRIACDYRILTMLSGDFSLPFRLFPAGRWREPPEQARKTDAAVVIVKSGEKGANAEGKGLASLGFTGEVFRFAYELTSWCNLDGTPAGFLSLPEGCSVGIFCALARPEQFIAWLASRGIAANRVWRYADHYRYRQGDVDDLCAEAQKVSLDLLITTEKDTVKIARFKTRSMRIIYPEVRLSPCADAGEFDCFLERVFDRGKND